MRSTTIASLGLATILAACASVDEFDVYPPPHADARLDRITWPALERFAGERAFRRYLENVAEEAVARGHYWSGVGESDRIVVTGSRIAAAPAASNPSITNVQERGVDEGDIVKQIDDFLVVLQDGRLFSIDTRSGGAPGLAFAARQDVYRSAEEDTWYDEILVFGRRIVVTGYSYAEDATEFSVFTLEEDGGFAREGVFYISSDDYYSVDNYATRIIGDRLIIHSPLRLSRINPVEPVVWPVVRRWRAEGDGGERADDAGLTLFNARDIYRPVQRTVRPTLHTISVCPLAAALSGEDLRCRTTAIIGPERDVVYVSPTDAWLWLSPGRSEIEQREPAQGPECDIDPGSRFTDSEPAALYRIPIDGGEPEVIGVRGVPSDQFALDASGREFRALLMWPPGICDQSPTIEPRYFRTAISRLDAVIRDAPERAYTSMPSPGEAYFENRFTDTHVTYAGVAGWYDLTPGEDEPPRSATVVAAPLNAPASARVLTASHGVIRMERAGDNIVLTGYRDIAGLSLSVLDLRDAPAITGAVALPGRFESENRSHAFNSVIGPDGAGIIAVPTVSDDEESERWWWRSEPSDVSFITIDAAARLAPAGELLLDKDGAHEDYACEVSCIDWYGNSRPIFTGGRIFALSGTELIEGQMRDGRIVDLRRVNLTAPPPQ